MSNGATPSQPRQLPCPTCGRLSAFAPSNRWRPFCSERCRNIDLGGWASESYRMPARPDPDDDTRDLPAPPCDAH
ncbi:MAG TPA: DNA gyrase inhibitor YacG [Burkholderiaceae bacterium]|nr:DNA gyrase inhibitor YacG [Burkholderiaceae bacterium]